MPLCEYQCGCGNEKDVLLSFQEADQPQICKCGRVMHRKVSLSSFIFKPYARNMALDSLNSKVGGVPARNPHKDWMQRKAFEGV